LQTAVTSLQTSNTALQAAVTALQSAMTTVQGQIAQIQTKNTQQDSAIAGLQSQVASINSVLSTLLGQSCSTGQFATGISAAGSMTCSTPATGAVLVNRQSVFDRGIPDDFNYHEVHRINLPAGEFAVALSGWYRTHETGVDEFYFECRLLAVTASASNVIDQVRVYLEGIEGTLSMMRGVSLATPGHVSMECRVDPGQDNAKFYQLNSLTWKVDGNI
jgi:hypothetical protein